MHIHVSIIVWYAQTCPLMLNICLAIDYAIAYINTPVSTYIHTVYACSYSYVSVTYIPE